MKTVMTVCVAVATTLCGIAAVMCWLGYGEPNVSAGESLFQFWVTLWGCGFVGCFGGIMIPCIIGVTLRRITG